jgi:hypothetical protein
MQVTEVFAKTKIVLVITSRTCDTLTFFFLSCGSKLVVVSLPLPKRARDDDGVCALLGVERCDDSGTTFFQKLFMDSNAGIALMYGTFLCLRSGLTKIIGALLLLLLLLLIVNVGFFCSSRVGDDWWWRW